MAEVTQKLYAVSHTLVSGSLSGASNAYGSPDGVFTTNSGDVSWTAEFHYDSAAAKDTPLGTQTFKALVRSSDDRNNPGDVDSIDLYVDGAFVRTIATPGTISASISTTVSGTYDASEVGSGQPSIRMTTSSSGGSPSGRESVQIDYAELEVRFDTVVDDELEDSTADDAILTEVQDNPHKVEDVSEWVQARAENYELTSYVEGYYVQDEYYFAGTQVADEEAADAIGETAVLSQSRGVADDLLEDATGEPELLAATQAAVADLLEDATGEPELLTAVQGAVVDTQEDATGEPELLAATQAAVADRAADADADETVLTEEQTSEAGDEFTEEIDREDTILQQVVAYFQDVAEDVAAEVEVPGQHVDAVADREALTSADAEATLEQPHYVADEEAAGSAEATVLNTTTQAAADLLEDTNASLELLSAALAAVADEEALAEGKGQLVAKDDVEETAEAYGEVPTDPLREDVTEWVWPRARVAQTYSDDVEEVRAVEVSYRSKLFLDITVDIDALAELDGEHRDNRADRTAQADAEALVEATISALADLEEEAYIGGAVTSQLGSFYNTLIEDVGADDELTQRLVTDVDLAADADGRDDVAGTAWFKAHSFIEEATAAEELLSETIRRPTKDDVAEDATGDVATLSTVLHAVAAWSEDTLAEDELLGNESGEAWVFNTRTLAFSRYADFEASQVTTVDDEPLAAGARGVMAYSDTRAEGFVKTGLSDYGAPQLKRVRHAYITAASRQPLALSTLHGIGDTLQRTTYQVATLDSTVPYTHRLNLARGDQGQFWAFELRAPAGPPTTLLNLRIIPLVTSRRI